MSKGRWLEGATALGMYGPGGPSKGVSMILSLCVSIKKIVECGRDFAWPKPESCPQCHGDRVWGHGFVGTLFDGFLEQVLMKRWRCPDCRCVMKARPDGYFNRFQAPVGKIRSSIAYRLRTGRWPPGSSRSRQGHWLRALRRNVKARLKDQWTGGLMAGFAELMDRGIIPVSRSI